jgi:hypothetical protein
MHFNSITWLHHPKMTHKQFPPLPNDAMLSFGGFSCVQPLAWECYLERMTLELYPGFTARPASQPPGDLWRQRESCVLTSLEKYLLTHFGIHIPEDNLFRIYNTWGNGIGLENMLEAVSAVVEPLGLEIDCVLVADEEIRLGLGESDKVIGIDQASQVEGRPGIGMINIAPGQSHAFYWPIIDRRGFVDDKFRLVLLLKRKSAVQNSSKSAIAGAEAFFEFLADTLENEASVGHFTAEMVSRLKAEMLALRNYLHQGENMSSQGFRAEVDARLTTILSNILDGFSVLPQVDSSIFEKAAPVYEAGQMMRHVFRDIEVIT